MTKEEILQLDRIEEYREGNQLEAKAAQGGLPDTLWDSYSAFANTDGGPSVPLQSFPSALFCRQSCLLAILDAAKLVLFFRF